MIFRYHFISINRTTRTVLIQQDYQVLSHLYNCTESYCTTPSSGVISCIGTGKMLKFFNVMGKGLLGELFCTGKVVLSITGQP